MRPAFGSRLNTSPSVGAPLTSVPSLPASPFRSCPSRRRCSTRVCRCRRRRSCTSSPLAPTRRSLPSPPLSVSLLSAPVRTSSPAPPLSPTAATSVFFASTVSESLPLAAVDDDGERAVGGHGLLAVGRAVPVRAAVEAAGRLIVHEQAARHRHRHVVVGAVEVQRRGGSVDRRRGDRRAGGTAVAPKAAASAAPLARPESSCVSRRVLSIALRVQGGTPGRERSFRTLALGRAMSWSPVAAMVGAIGPPHIGHFPRHRPPNIARRPATGRVLMPASPPSPPAHVGGCASHTTPGS